MTTNDTEILLDTLEPDQQYIFVMDSFTESGVQADSIELIFQTAPSPPEIMFQEITSYRALLYWNNITNFDFYKVGFEPDVGFVPEKIFGQILEIQNLQENTTFTVSIVGVINGVETDSYRTTFKTAPTPPTAKLSNVRTSEFEINWTEVENANFYELEFFPRPDYLPDGIIRVNDAASYIATSLASDTDYQIVLSAVIDDFTRTSPVTLNRKTAPEAPIVVAKDITSTKMSLDWSHVEGIAHYILNIFPKIEKVPDNLQLLKTGLSLDDLQYDTRYQIQVKAVLLDESETDIGYLQVLTAPKPPTLMMANVRTTTAKVFWTKSQRVNSYRVRVSPSIEGQTNFDRNSTSLILLGTRASVEYIISVVALVDGAETDLVDISLLTGDLLYLLIIELGSKNLALN